MITSVQLSDADVASLSDGRSRCCTFVLHSKATAPPADEESVQSFHQNQLDIRFESRKSNWLQSFPGCVDRREISAGRSATIAKLFD